jgi:hypothetical protein
MVRNAVAALLLVCLVGLCACAPADPVGGTWRQIATVDDDGSERPVAASAAVVMELRRGGRATLFLSGPDAEGTAFTWSADRGLLKLADHPGWDVRTVHELAYELRDDRLTADWIGGPPRRILERQ